MSKKIQKFAKKNAKKDSRKAGLPPGTVVYLGEQRIENVRITVIDYNENSFSEKEVQDIDQALQPKIDSNVRWINIDGLHNTQLVEKVGSYFDIHPIVLEDIVHTAQRPKLEEFEKHFFVVLKMLSLENQSIKSEQVSIVWGDGFVISFQESVGDVFDVIRQRIRSGKGRIRKMGSDFLAYSLLDSIVDNYFFILEEAAERIEALQEQVANEPTTEVLHKIHELKREMLFLRRAVWPLRELVSNLQKTDSDIIKDNTQIFIRDLYDHIVQIIDTTETLREMSSSILDVYLSSVSNKMNAVMKVLTIIATIFIPLTFIAGVYGMNFENMPELQYKWMYPWAFWISSVVIFFGMLVFFKFKKWL